MRFDMQSLPDSGVYVQLNQHLKRLVVFRKRVLQYSFSDGTIRSCPLFSSALRLRKYSFFALKPCLVIHAIAKRNATQGASQGR